MNLRQILTAPHSWEVFPVITPIKDPADHYKIELETREATHNIVVSSLVAVPVQSVLDWLPSKMRGHWLISFRQQPIWSDEKERFLYFFSEG